MASLFTQAPYAEDQQNARPILYLHVARASAMTFTFFSLFRLPITIIRAQIRKAPVVMSAVIARTLQSSSRAFAIGSAVGVFMTWGRMRGREEIEWQDRAWRILGNRGEVQTDWATVSGIGAGAVAVAVGVSRGVVPGSVGKAMIGGAGAGSSVGKSFGISCCIWTSNTDFCFLGIPFMVGTYATGRKPA
jgi:hypothetical protein